MAEAQTVLCQMKPYIQPFERQLALRELQALAGSIPSPEFDLGRGPSQYRVLSNVSGSELAARLTFWETVADPQPRWTRQLLREASTEVARSRGAPSQLRNCLPLLTTAVKPPARRSLRYGPHGAHEYRGKFFPQLVRSLINMAGLEPGAVVLDPMCGSGTTLVEAQLAGCSAMGVDLNPLSAMMSRVKCDVLRLPATLLIDEYEALNDRLTQARVPSGMTHWSWFVSLPPADQRYLEKWFQQSVLAELEAIVAAVEGTPHAVCREFFWLCLSDTLRSVSWQKLDDLRIRRAFREVETGQALRDFHRRVEGNVKQLASFLLQEQMEQFPPYEVREGDARLIGSVGSPLADAVITSPPYATALPYLDTDRLSLIYLGLLERTNHRSRDQMMIGNREISDSSRVRLLEEFRRTAEDLPVEVEQLVALLDENYGESDVGFRRRNLPALIGRYFQDMSLVLRGIFQSVRERGHVFLVVGDNHTIANGTRIDIDTSRLLGAIAERSGFQLLETIPMEMLPPRDIFSKNSVVSENIIHLIKN